MSIWNVPQPSPSQSFILQAVGEAMLWPSSSERWRTVFFWIDGNRDHEIARSILSGFAAAGGNVDEALELGRDWEMVKEPRWLTRSFAAADGGDVEANLLMRLERRQQAAHRRAATQKEELFG